MTKFKLLLMFVTTALVFTNCSHDYNNDDNDDDNGGIIPATQSSFKSIRDAALQSLIQDTTFKAENGLHFTSAKGVELNINCLSTSDGTPVTGDVKLEYVEIFDRGNMLVANKPLMGRDRDGYLQPLITGGEFSVKVTQNGKELIPCSNYSLRVPTSLTGGVKPGMTLWEGTIDADGDLEWDNIQDVTGGNREDWGVVGGKGEFYDAFCGKFGWTNIDILAGEPGEKTPIKVRVPEGYTNKNAAVYVLYKGRPGILACLDTYDSSEKVFTEHYGWGPIGFSLYLIFVSENEGNFIYSIKDVTLQKDEIIVFATSDLEKVSKDDLVAIINSQN